MGASRSQPRIVIVGAGLQGTCVALALAQRGVRSTLLDWRDEPLRGASHGNEGKIHLGFVYALDTSLRTAREMLPGALSFAPLLDRWCGPLPWHAWRSSGFLYAVMPDSLADRTLLQGHYESIRRMLPEIAASLELPADYIGTQLGWTWRPARSPHGGPVFDGRPVECIDTEEVAVDTGRFADELRARLRRHPSIELRCGQRVVGVDRSGSGTRLHLETAGGLSAIDADIVINCAWTERVRLDRLAGFADRSVPLSYRVKHRVIVRPREAAGPIVPVTMVQGPYGDVVPYRNGNVYLSWYPECRTFFDQAPPASEIASAAVLGDIATRTMAAMSAMFPALAGAQVLSCSPCTIVAEGSSDVDDPESMLHRRTDTGPRGGGNWWSVDTGKLTLAPLHGEETARLVMEGL